MALKTELKELISEYGLIERSAELARKNFRRYAGLSPEGDIRCEISSCCYVINNYDLDTESECIQIDVDYYDNTGYLGYYSVVFDPDDGSITDDWIRLDGKQIKGK